MKDGRRVQNAFIARLSLIYLKVGGIYIYNRVEINEQINIQNSANSFVHRCDACSHKLRYFRVCWSEYSCGVSMCTFGIHPVQRERI